MEMLIVGLGIFFTMVLVIELCFYAVRHSQPAQRRNVRKRLRTIDAVSWNPGEDIYRHRALSDIGALDWLLRKIPGLSGLDRLLEQSDAKYPLGFYLLLSLLLAAFGGMTGVMLNKNPGLPYLLAAIMGFGPYAFLNHKKRARSKQFQSQLPESLDLISRALKAGHAFTSGMQLAAKEFKAPLGKEFQQVVDEVNFGVSMPEALKHLAQRIDSAELRFFVVSVILQRETGGNLAEIITSLASLMRERFKLHGKIRVLSAEGRISALILVVLPFVVMGFLQIRNPDYIGMLFTEPAGRIMSLWGLILMIAGMLVIKKLVTIKV